MNDFSTEKGKDFFSREMADREKNIFFDAQCIAHSSLSIPNVAYGCIFLDSRNSEVCSPISTFCEEEGTGEKRQTEMETRNKS